MTLQMFLCILIAIALVVDYVIFFVKMPQNEQKEEIDALKSAMYRWLKKEVFEAEKEMGGGTGSLKLATVYSNFIKTFPKLVSVISFEEFSKYVDDALVWLNKQLECNPAIQQLIK